MTSTLGPVDGARVLSPRRPGALRRLTVFVALVTALSALAAPAPASAGSSPLPACRHDDVLTRWDDPSRWRITLVDPIRRVPSDYRPGPLAPVSDAGLNGSYRVRRLMLDDLRALGRAARGADAAVAVISGYRTYARQKELFRREVRDFGRERALRRVARAGHSEHQLGTALDFRSGGSTRLPWSYDDWANTRPGRWMERNAWRYGFLMSYPAGMSDTTCYRYEPWHYRYVGRHLAAEIHASGLTVREYLWRHFERP